MSETYVWVRAVEPTSAESMDEAATKSVYPSARIPKR